MPGDVIDLSSMGAFHFLGADAFDGAAGALNYMYQASTGITTLQGDKNGDRIADFAIDLVGQISLFAVSSSSIGAQSAPPLVIESVAATSLAKDGANFFLIPTAGGTGPQLRYNGSAVTAGQFGTWTPIGAEQTASGYDVAWKDTANNRFTVWSTDSSGNYLSNIVPSGPGSSTALRSIETIFQQDLNGDGTIGLPAGSQSAPATPSDPL